MIVTTTHTVDGKEISEYLRIVAGETIVGINVFKDFGASIRNLVGGRSQSYENEVLGARETALKEMVDRAIELGAHGVVGVTLAYQTMGADNGMMMVTATGTAVKFAY